MWKNLLLGGLLLAVLHANVLGGMGRQVGLGAHVVTAFTTLCLYAWPACLVRAGSPWRLSGYLTAPFVFGALAFQLTHGTWLSAEWKGVWFNTFGETLIIVQVAKAVLLTLLSAATIEAIRNLDQRRDARGDGRPIAEDDITQASPREEPVG